MSLQSVRNSGSMPSDMTIASNLQRVLDITEQKQNELKISIVRQNQDIAELQLQADVLQRILTAYQVSITQLQAELNAMPELQAQITTLQTTFAEIKESIRYILLEIANRHTRR